MEQRTEMEAGAGPKYEVKVLGCKVNAYEARQIERALELNGLCPVGPGDGADVVVVHSCAVTNEAVRKSRQMVRRLQKQHPGARVVVTGCAASEGLLSRVPGLSARIAPREDWLAGLHREVRRLVPGVSAAAAPGDHLPIETFRGQARAFLKIQDGCDIGCSFCIVPRLRRAPRDKPIDEVVGEARVLAGTGHRELVVSGVSVGLYGRAGGGPNFSEVVRRLIDIEGVERIRISSLHPRELTDELLGVWASSPKMMPHLHLPLQAGSDSVLRAMRRGYTAAEFLRAVDRARSVLDDPGINADVIVGFPGETEADFAATVAVCRRAEFSRMHVFPYSPRPHTRAARLGGRVDPAVARDRCARLREEGRVLANGFARKREGCVARVLCEHWDPKTGEHRGYDERYVPVQVPGPPRLRGHVISVQHREAVGEGTRASRIAPASKGNLGH